MRVAAAVCLALLTACLASCGDAARRPSPLAPELERTVLSLSPLPPLPDDPTNGLRDDPRARRLGRFLFFDARLSADGRVSCATCHDPERGFADGQPLGKGLAELVRHTPTLFNVAWNRWFYWDGRVDTLWGQAAHPIEAPDEMGGTRVATARLIAGDPRLREAYEAIFGAIEAPFEDAVRFPPEARPGAPSWDAMSAPDQAAATTLFANVVKSIAAYETTIVSTDSAFDRFVAGLRSEDAAAIDRYPADALRGLRIFVGRGGCTLCHLGGELTDREFHNIGFSKGATLARGHAFAGLGTTDLGRFVGVERLAEEEFSGRGQHSDAPTGRHNDKLRYVAQKENNLGEFKTPTLRSVTRSAPYMHDGRLATLEDVLRHYSRLESEAAIGHREESLAPFALNERDVADMIAFLRSLDGAPLPPEVMTPPDDPRMP